MTDDLLVLLGLWCFAVFCFGAGWFFGATARMGKHADDIIDRFECRDPEAQWVADQKELWRH